MSAFDPKRTAASTGALSLSCIKGDFMKRPSTPAEIDDYLFGAMSLESYSVSETGTISFIGTDGRQFDLHFGDEQLHKACLDRLRELGVRKEQSA